MRGEQDLHDDELALIGLRDTVLRLTRQALDCRQNTLRDAANYLETHGLVESANALRDLAKHEREVAR